ncbi:MAG TPA: MFS transporter [Candidatus Limnocylindria bacterium]|nr:MFS transporter [Candidatus Limnocylindria bacterium]
MNVLRKRELLLSLKNCTIEACFSVPMLTLTLGNMPFLIGFAVKALGWSDSAIGLLAAMPFICLFLQPPITFWLQRHWSLHRIMSVTFFINALPWLLTLLFPWLGEAKHALFAVIVFISNLGNAVCGVTWSASISELVPLNIRGKYFGTRNMMFGFWSLVAVLVAGQLAEHFGNVLFVFGIIFTIAACARLIGLFFLTRMKFPARVMEVQPQRAPLDTFTAVFRDKNFVRLLLFTGLFGLFFNAGQPFYSVFVLKELPFTLGDLVVLTTVQTLGLLFSLRTWGTLVDRFGNKPVMLTTALIWLTLAGISWLFASPAHHAYLYATYFLTGFMLAGFQNMGQFNLMIKMVPAENRAHYLSVYFSFTNLLVALGPVLGGVVLRNLPERFGTLFGQPLTRYHLVICGSIALSLLTLLILRSVREPAAKSMRDLVNVMWHMREFNPMLAATTVAEYVFTPRGLGKLARSSLRTLRRHSGVIEDVGEELFEGGRRVLKAPRDKRP